MPITFDCFLNIAKLSAENVGEQWSRNAVSRAYYSMYHSALRLVDGKVPTRDSNGVKIFEGSHARFYNYLCDGRAAQDFGLEPVKTKSIGLMLKAGHFNRVIADYKLSLKMNKIIAITTIEEAGRVDAMVEEMTSKPV